MGICCMSQEAQTGALYQPRGVGGGRGVQERGDIHVAVWQKPTEFCKAIILQLKNKYIKKNRARKL